MTIKTYPTYLTVNTLTVNRAVARRLSPAIAFQYHALPVAKDNDRITVAMANPNDEIACDAIADNLGEQPYIVKGNQDTIDQQLASIWPGIMQRKSLNILVCNQNNRDTDSAEHYAEYIGSLLNGQLTGFPLQQTHDNFNTLIESAKCFQDLVIFSEPDQPLFKQILSGPSGCKAVERLPTSVLITRQPRWPLKRILLVSRGYHTDNLAVDWLVRLVQPSKALTTILALTPGSSASCQRAATTMPHGLADWLASDTPLGHQLRRISEQMMNWEIQGRLRFRQGAPVEQIEQEITEEDYSLVIIAADPDDWWQRRLLGEVVNPLLHWINCPVLVAKCLAG